MDVAKLKDKIDSRRWAEECYEAATDKQAFVERVMELACPPPPPMKTNEASLFEKWRMPFGLHKDAPVGSVPISYLTWLLNGKTREEMDRFLNKLRRYLQSARAKVRRDEEGGDDAWEDPE